MRGILSTAVYLPYRRLDRAEIAPIAGGGGGKGRRTVASFDEDTTTMGVEAARLALRPVPGVVLDSVWFATTTPAYADRTNATAIHAALRLGREVVAADANGAVRSAVAVLRSSLIGGGPALVVAADMRTGFPGSSDEATGGDAAAALVIGDETDGALLASFLGGASATEEFLDRWRTPGDVRSKVWEERFGEGKYTALAEQAWTAALKRADLTEVDDLIVTGTHARAVGAVAKRLAGSATVADTYAGSVGHTGAAHPALMLAAVLEQATPGRTIALVSLADGADVLLFRTTEAVREYTPARPVAAQVDGGGAISYGKFLAWRGVLPVEPPRRPEPARVSASAAGRSEAFKFGLVGSRDTATGSITLPPAIAGADPTSVLEPAPMSGRAGTVVTFTIDRLAYSPSPPVVFAVVDFDGGGRLPIEVTDVDADGLAVGDRVEPTFRRLSTADGIHNYFWKVRPLRGGLA